MDFTPDQKKVIEARNTGLLVSAAAGSGKTAVLVERIIQLITDPENPVDIDSFLVVTFTRAAAAQMKEKISRAITAKLELNPADTNLQRQAALVHNAQISTIDSFCQYVLRNSVSETEPDPGFRIADEAEMKLLKADILDELIEELYTEGSEDFLNMSDSLVMGADDTSLNECILKLYETSQSDPWPDRWLEKHASDYRADENGDAPGGELLDALKASVTEKVISMASSADRALKLAEDPAGPYPWAAAIEKERDSLTGAAEMLQNSRNMGYDDISVLMDTIVFDRLPQCRDKSVNADIKESCRGMRDGIKAAVGNIKKLYFNRSAASHLEQMAGCDRVLSELCRVTLLFSERLKRACRERGILSFSGCEHMALDVLVHPLEDGGYEYTEAAAEYRSHYSYVMIDEYQDSNMIQELLLGAVSGEADGIFNRFMVGDVKQSIYRFRQADPGIFTARYEEYGENTEGHLRVDLHQNFRSRRQVLDSCNDLFRSLMSPQLGDVRYDDTAALCPGAVYPAEDDSCYVSEMYVYDTENEDDLKGLEVEAEGVAARIAELMEDLRVSDPDGDSGLRPVQYRDIVILLRSPSTSADIFKKALEERSIPVHVAGTEGYFASAEIRTLLQFLNILVNPLQDISFYGVMVSVLGGFTDEEAAQIRILYTDSLPDGEHTKEGYLYDACRHMAEVNGYDELREKTADFLDMLAKYRELSEYLPVEELLCRILKETGYRACVYAMRGGERRLANVDMLIRKAADYGRTGYFGLFNFLRYVEMIRKYSIDEAEAEAVDENSDVVRIMSIHKSKGLEFPVCFVSGLGKKFNKLDSRENIVVDRHLGIGIRDTDPVRRTKSNTLRRAFIAERITQDTLSEELRVLYVAMTRAKEKLIMTCAVKNAPDAMKKASSAGIQGGCPDPVTLRTAGGFSDWIFMAMAAAENCHMNLCFSDHEASKAEKLGEAVDMDRKKAELEYMLGTNSVDITKTEYGRFLEDLYTRSYPHSDITGLYTKTSVSVLKHAAMDREAGTRYEFSDEAESAGEKNAPEVKTVPKFISGTSDRPEATVRGSAFHRVLELMDIAHMAEIPDDGLMHAVIEELDRNTESGRLSREQRKIFYSKKETELLLGFIRSTAGIRMAAAAAKGTLKREAPFMLGLPASELGDSFPAEETVLIQGIIDAYWREDDGYVILDYKTDRVQTAEQLIGLYKTQLDYYQKALEQMHMHVKDKLIYSFALGEVIRLGTGEEK